MDRVAKEPKPRLVLASAAVVAFVPPFANGKVPVTPVVSGSPVQLVKVPEDGVPSAGVTSVGLVANTKAPEPVSPVTAAARLALEGVAKNVATFVPKPLIPVDTGNPVQLVNVPADGVPIFGVVKVGLVAKTNEPEPVSSVTAAAKLDELGVPKNVATPEPNPDTPVDIGSPVQLVKVPEVGVPNTGVTNVGVFANTKAPVPVSSDTAEARLALDGVARNVATFVPKPLIPVDTGKPVQLVKVPEAGVPSAGVTNVGLDIVGEAFKTTLPVPVEVFVPVPPEVTGRTVPSVKEVK